MILFFFAFCWGRLPAAARWALLGRWAPEPLGRCAPAGRWPVGRVPFAGRWPPAGRRFAGRCPEVPEAGREGLLEADLSSAEVRFFGAEFWAPVRFFASADFRVAERSFLS